MVELFKFSSLFPNLMCNRKSLLKIDFLIFHFSKFAKFFSGGRKILATFFADENVAKIFFVAFLLINRKKKFFY